MIWFETRNDWMDVLREEFDKEYYKELISFLSREYEEQTIYPKREDLFKALELTAYKDVKVVIIGQDPYHGEGQAHGLCFSVQKGIKVPPSLRNIYKEMKADLGYEPPSEGCLTKWADEGILLLNTVLTVRASEANSHRKKGWEKLTDCIIRKLNDRAEPIVFILWGNPAKKKKDLITNEQHLVLEAAHPSPLSASRGFFGCNHFSKTNDFLIENNLGSVDWKID